MKSFSISYQSFHCVPKCICDLWPYDHVASFSILRMKLASDVFTFNIMDLEISCKYVGSCSL